MDYEIILEIKNSHDFRIEDLVHYSNKANKKDLFISFDVSNRKKIIDVNTWVWLYDFDVQETIYKLFHFFLL